MLAADQGELGAGLATATGLITADGMSRVTEMRTLEVLVSLFNAMVVLLLYGTSHCTAMFVVAAACCAATLTNAVVGCVTHASAGVPDHGTAAAVRATARPRLPVAPADQRH